MKLADISQTWHLISQTSTFISQTWHLISQTSTLSAKPALYQPNQHLYQPNQHLYQPNQQLYQPNQHRYQPNQQRYQPNRHFISQTSTRSTYPQGMSVLITLANALLCSLLSLRIFTRCSAVL